MKKAYVFLFVVGLGLVLMAGVAFAATATGTLTVNAAVSSTAKLQLSSSTISFPDADPDTTPSIASVPASITVTAKAKTSSAGNVTLTALAGGNLVSGINAIAIDNVTWAGAGTGFNGSGIMNTITPQSVGNWTGSGNQTGTLTFSFANSWSYLVGNYTAAVTYTLTAP
jgi:hypothetical protein